MDDAQVDEHLEQSSVELEAPELEPDLLEYLVAFNNLSPSRRVGMGLGGIPVSDMHAYCVMFEIEDQERFFYLIRVLDSAYLQHASSTTSKGSADAQRPNSKVRTDGRG